VLKKITTDSLIWVNRIHSDRCDSIQYVCSQYSQQKVPHTDIYGMCVQQSTKKTPRCHKKSNAMELNEGKIERPIKEHMEKRTGRVAGLTWGLMESAAHGQMLVGGL